jgi:hypothetical protein
MQTRRGLQRDWEGACVCVSTRVRECVYVCAFVLHVRESMYTCVRVRVHVCMCVCLWVCM